MDRRNFLGVMCGAAVMPPKELLKAFEPTSKVVWAEWHEVDGKYFVSLMNKSKGPIGVFIEFTMAKGIVSEVTLTVDGEKGIIKPKWGVSPTT